MLAKSGSYAMVPTCSLPGGSSRALLSISIKYSIDFSQLHQFPRSQLSEHHRSHTSHCLSPQSPPTPQSSPTLRSPPTPPSPPPPPHLTRSPSSVNVLAIITPFRPEDVRHTVSRRASRTIAAVTLLLCGHLRGHALRARVSCARRDASSRPYAIILVYIAELAPTVLAAAFLPVFMRHHMSKEVVEGATVSGFWFLPESIRDCNRKNPVFYPAQLKCVKLQCDESTSNDVKDKLPQKVTGNIDAHIGALALAYGIRVEGGVWRCCCSPSSVLLRPTVRPANFAMDPPSSRELELEELLRRRDAQVIELTDEVTHLRQYLSIQPGPSTTDPVSLPPTLVSLLLPHINAGANDASANFSSSTVTTALTQRAKLLQEENDELYEILKNGETGRLKEEVRGLKRVVDNLETALRGSHAAIRTLSEELDKSHEVILSTGRHHNNANAHPRLPSRQTYHHSTSAQSTSNGNAKPLPTGPRAHKKARLSEPQISPSNSTSALPRIQTQSQGGSAPSHTESPERSPILSPDHRKVPSVKMEVDDDQRTRPRSPAPRDRGRDRERDRGRDRDRDRDRERTSRRNGGGQGGRRSGRVSTGSFSSGDRTLAERMGL
ncbi:hypothetical protein EW146_g7602 [Bondarzewia mesenterica]|uniref:Uncharacterized protein n=1 Tax=Bondarzewia mesenterica TaxID=1095465 RepID=A0A4S4LKH4_9AGAM|nr:hypothetical protein EW146_g7602 [Bondarzewia mesenterica]